jgi:hypothetical protein
MSLASKGKAKSATHRKNISKGTTGKPKPWCNGERNPNFGNKAQDSVREKFLAASKKRGLAWSDEDRDRHRAFGSEMPKSGSLPSDTVGGVEVGNLKVVFLDF